MELLGEDAITRNLATVPGWERHGDSIEREVLRADFREAMAFVNAVAELAEEANHHPDIIIRWNRVTLTLSTHAAGGLTAQDFELARRINALAG